MLYSNLLQNFTLAVWFIFLDIQFTYRAISVNQGFEARQYELVPDQAKISSAIH